MVGLAGGLWTYAAMSAGSQLFGRTLIAGRDPGEVALTFDDGPNGDTTLRLLDVLAGYGARATFFVIGNHVRRQPGIVRAVAAAGHVVGNHTMTHPWLHVATGRRIREELEGCAAVLEDVLGERARFFRAPHGARRPGVLRYVDEMGMVPVQWNVMGKDWTQPQDAGALTRRVLRGVAWNRSLGRGTNVLLHDGSDRGLGADRGATLQAVALLLAGFQAMGMHAVAIDGWDKIAGAPRRADR